MRNNPKAPNGAKAYATVAACYFVYDGLQVLIFERKAVRVVVQSSIRFLPISILSSCVMIIATTKSNYHIPPGFAALRNLFYIFAM